MLTANKISKLIPDSQFTNMCLYQKGNHVVIYYRCIEIGKLTEWDGCQCDLHWITCIALAKRPTCRHNPLVVPFIETKNKDKADAFNELVRAYVRSVYKSPKSARIQRRNHTGLWGRNGIIAEDDFKKDLEDMKRYIDAQLSFSPVGGTTFAVRIGMWHQRCRRTLTDVESVERIDFDDLSRKIDNASKKNNYVAKITLYNGHEAVATAVDDTPGLPYWEELFFVKLTDGSIVMAKCSRRKPSLKIGTGELEVHDSHYKVEKVSVMTKEFAEAVSLLHNMKDKEIVNVSGT